MYLTDKYSYNDESFSWFLYSLSKWNYKHNRVRGDLVYPSSGNYGVNETKCWRIEVPKPYEGIGIYIH